ncbi:MAG: hypothetical protein IPM31_15535 [Anaerolineae bacterium]|nr:hypothetical protein [Anaerolineae bacterium]MBL8106850.1 hypothetical protein [Anaerolineales bacterium]MCC7187411.1 hypothetical protein [Anaerolineales bacterium]
MRQNNGIRTGWRFRFLRWSLLIILVGSGFASSPSESASPVADPPGPDRFSVTLVEYTEYTWWMIRWGSNQFICELKTDHEGLPTIADVYSDCLPDDYDDWVNQKPCTEHDVSLCKGNYLVLIESQPAQKEVATKLPSSSVQVSLENCNPVYTSSTSICEAEPILILNGIEPLPEHQIIRIEGLYAGQSFVCDAHCRLRLPITGENGETLQFWAFSSYGDSSPIFNALVRVAQAESNDPDQAFWYVDVLSSQWMGVPVASCVETWKTLPPIGGPQEWLSTPTQSETLGTDIPYNYLAANLIRKGVVDAVTCENNGLQEDGNASSCGMDKARGAVTAWQNQFDEIILNVAKDTGAPANLLKNLFAKESQFWPGIGAKDDVGLGQLTEQGADTTLMWNPPFFNQFCPLVMDSEECKKGYLGLEEDQMRHARLALIQAVNATCEDCPLGIDLDRANFSIGVFAHTLLANCEQAGQLVRNVNAAQTAGSVSTYEDLWKFSLVNYHAGPGCLGDALDLTFAKSLEMTWENVSSNLSAGCSGAVDYVNDISE